MKPTEKPAASRGFRLSFEDDHGQELGRAYIYIMKNDPHEKPFALMEDVFVGEPYRGQGIGRQLIQLVIDRAKAEGCYKLVAMSRNGRHRVHGLYLEFGFAEHGKEFRMELK